MKTDSKKEVPSSNFKNWYEKTAWIIFFLIFFFPVGLFLMWKSNWKKAPKIIISLFYVIGFWGIITAPSLESVEISADTGKVYDIHTEIPIKVTTDPENYPLSESAFNVSGGEIVEKDGAFAYSSLKSGKYTVYVKTGNIKSNELTFTINDKTAATESKKRTSEAPSPSPTATAAPAPTATPEPTAAPEPNSTAMVDSLAKQAKESANKSASEDKREEALNFIADTYPNYFSDNSTMEKAIYYGYYLEYAYEANGPENLYANLGMDVEQVSKNVYRGVDDLNSDYVQSNLHQIEESLSSLGLLKTETTSEVIQEPREELVWISESGSKYHNDSSCSNMENPTQVTLSEAQGLGLEACKKCY